MVVTRSVGISIVCFVARTRAILLSYVPVGKLVAIALIKAFARVGPAIGLALLAHLLVIRIAVLLGTFTFALVRIIGRVVASGRLARMILGQVNYKR